jgi:hypothetical protein
MSAAAIPSMARAIGVRLTSEPPVNRRLETSNLGGRARTAPSYRRLGRRKHAEQPEKALEAARPRRCGRSPAPRARSRPAPITPRPGVRAERASGSLPRMKSARPASFTSAGPDLRPPAGGVAAAGGLHPGLGVGLAPLLCLCVTRREPPGGRKDRMKPAWPASFLVPQSSPALQGPSRSLIPQRGWFLHATPAAAAGHPEEGRVRSRHATRPSSSSRTASRVAQRLTPGFPAGNLFRARAVSALHEGTRRHGSVSRSPAPSLRRR